MSKNYYEEKLDEIYSLIEDKKNAEAYDLIKEELKMPYVPEIYETKFVEILENMKSELPSEIKSTMVPRDVAIEYLLSEDSQQEAIALELLRDHNLRYDQDLYKKKIETWGSDKNIFKAYLFELLVEQKINIDINFNGIKMNPSKNGTILKNKEVEIAMNEIQKWFEKNPSALALALDEAQRFLLITYPAIPESGIDYARDISKIVESMFDEKMILTERQTKMKELLKK